MSSWKLRLATLLLLLLTSVTAAPSALAQDDELNAENIEQSYVKVYMDWNTIAADDETPPFIMMVAVLDMVDDDAASEQMDAMLKSMEEDADYADFLTEEVDDLGERAIRYTAEAGDSEDPQHGMIAKDGDVLFFVMTMGADIDENLPTDVVTFMIEKGPSDDPVTKEDEGSGLSGGWVEAFPTAEDFPVLENMDGNAVYDLLEDGFFGDDLDIPDQD